MEALKKTNLDEPIALEHKWPISSRFEELFFCNLYANVQLFKHGHCLYKEPWTGRAVSHFILDLDPSTSQSRITAC